MHFTSSDLQAILPTDYTFAVGDQGTHTFSVTLKTAGSRSITATDTVTGSVTGTQSGITVTPAAASRSVGIGVPDDDHCRPGSYAHGYRADPYSNIATGYTGVVHFTSSDLQAILPTDYTFVVGDQGTHTFSVTLKTAGSRSITATDTVTGSITGTQAGIIVTPAAASILAISEFPTTTTAGQTHTLRVTAARCLQ